MDGLLVLSSKFKCVKDYVEEEMELLKHLYLEVFLNQVQKECFTFITYVSQLMFGSLFPSLDMGCGPRGAGEKLGAAQESSMVIPSLPQPLQTYPPPLVSSPQGALRLENPIVQRIPTCAPAVAFDPPLRHFDILRNQLV